MSSLTSVLTRSAFLKQGAFAPKWITPVSCMATMKPMSPAEHKISRENFWAKQDRLKRPLSPHITIYKFPMSSNLSITHRFTGIALTGMMVGGALGTVLLPMPFPEALAILQNMHFGPAVIYTAKLAITWPLCYHLLNGVRHLFWDLGYGLQIPDLNKTGWTVIAASVIASMALSAM